MFPVNRLGFLVSCFRLSREMLGYRSMGAIADVSTDSNEGILLVEPSGSEGGVLLPNLFEGELYER